MKTARKKARAWRWVGAVGSGGGHGVWGRSMRPIRSHYVPYRSHKTYRTYDSPHLLRHTQQTLDTLPPTRAPLRRMPTAGKRPTPAALAAAREQRAHVSAVRLLERAVSFLGAQPVTAGEVIDCRGAAISASLGRTMIDAQKFRLNFYALPRKELGAIARLLSERNWFARAVHALRHAVYGAGFALDSAAAVAWVADANYPFQQVHDDLLHEWLVSDNVVALWRTDPEPTTLPQIEVPIASRSITR